MRHSENQNSLRPIVIFYQKYQFVYLLILMVEFLQIKCIFSFTTILDFERLSLTIWLDSTFITGIQISNFSC